jgi:hypothetical protein
MKTDIQDLRCQHAEISMEDEGELERLNLAYSRRFQNLLHKAKKEIQESGGIAHKDFWQDIEN